MLVRQAGPANKAVWWWRSKWVAELLLVAAVLSLTPWFFSSTELVRIRNALLLDQQEVNDFNWTPATAPRSFKLERGPIDPFFADVARRLELSALPDDWARALAISRHLLSGTQPKVGGPIKSDLRETYRRIMTTGEGYCGDYTNVFMGVALAAGIPVRAWAFSFDGFGGHGHIWPEIWNRQLSRWQLVGITNNFYFFETPGVPLSALEFRQALSAGSKKLQLTPLAPEFGVGWSDEAKAWDYYRRGLPEWYLWWGNNLFTYNNAGLVRAFSGVSRSLEQLGGIVQGVHPAMRILAEPGNQEQRDKMARLRFQVLLVGWIVGVIAALFMLSDVVLIRLRWSAWRESVSRANAAKASNPQIVVLTNLFPHAGTPSAGHFIRERMFRVGRELPLVVVVPVPNFPLQGLITQFRPHFRPQAPWFETNQGVPLFLPRFFSVPVFFRCFDGFFMALSCLLLVRRLKKKNPQTIIDAHFAYPAGYAAVLLGRWLNLPVTITMRGTEVSLTADPCRRSRMSAALKKASQVIAVSDSLRRHAGVLGVDTTRVKVIGNGVDLTRFRREDVGTARARLGIAPHVPVIVSVGGLVERKGFHRVIAVLPELVKKHPDLIFLIVGGPSPEGDLGEKLRQQVSDLNLGHVVRFLGALSPDDVRWPLSAANVFVLATSNEGWANVFLEAMACGLPVVTTNVGGNAEVVCRPELGTIVAFGDAQQLTAAIDQALVKAWDEDVIMAYAGANTWDNRIAELLHLFREVAARHFRAGRTATGSTLTNG